MDYSIQQLTLVHQSIRSSVDYRAGGTQEQLVIIKVSNSEHLTQKKGRHRSQYEMCCRMHGPHVVCHRQWALSLRRLDFKAFHNDPSDLHSSIQLLSVLTSAVLPAGTGPAEMIQGGVP